MHKFIITQGIGENRLIFFEGMNDAQVNPQQTPGEKPTKAGEVVKAEDSMLKTSRSLQNLRGELDTKMLNQRAQLEEADETIQKLYPLVRQKKATPEQMKQFLGAVNRMIELLPQQDPTNRGLLNFYKDLHKEFKN